MRACRITRVHLNTLVLLVLLGGATAADAQVQPQLARRCFEEATKLFSARSGRSAAGARRKFEAAPG
jgi:hypothetical protein